MDTKSKIIAGTIGGTIVLIGIYAAAVHRTTPATIAPAAITPTTESVSPATQPIGRGATVPGSVTSTNPSLPGDGAAVSGTQSAVAPAGRANPLMEQQPITDTTTPQSTSTVYHRSDTVYRTNVERSYRHEQPDNIHMARAAKHILGFTLKFPFRLRP